MVLRRWYIAFLLPNYKPMIQAQFRSRLEEARKKIPAIKVDWKVPQEPRSSYDPTKVALLIEPRPLPHLVPQILHMMTVVPPDWRFVFIGSEKSTVSVGRAFAVKHHQVIGKLDLMVLPEPWEIDSKEKVYRTLTDIRFYDEFLPGVEYILKYESDSILCANSEESLNDWLDWSWAGAPRYVFFLSIPGLSDPSRRSPEDRFSGNGGLSLRKVSAIRRILGFQARYNDSEAEDEWFGKRLWVLPGEKVAAGTSGVLAVEDVYMENPMGYHIRDGGSNLNDDVWKDHKQRKKILDYCPELSLIMNMKLERERCEGDDRDGVIHPTEEELEAERQKQLEEQRKIEEERKAKEEEERKKKLEEERAKAAAASSSAARLDTTPLDDVLIKAPPRTTAAGASEPPSPTSLLGWDETLQGER